MKSKPSSGALPAFAAISIAMALVVGAMCAFPSKEPRGGVSPEGPAVVTPTAHLSTERRQLTLALDLPGLSDRQRHYQHMAETIWRLPIAHGVDAPPIPMTDNEAVVFVALIYSECSFEPYDAYGNYLVNEIGARGCGQLMGDLVTTANMWSVELNMYDAAREFRRLLDANAGDVMASVRAYKGVVTSDTTYQANSIFDVIKVQG